MNLYQTEHTLLSSDVDALRRLRLSTLFALLQEAAIAHTTALGMGREKTLDRGLLWIITLQQAAIFRLPAYDERITILSWPQKTMHLYFPRCSRILDREGKTLVEASALWALMDKNTRKIVFPEQYGIRIDGAPAPSDPPLPRAPRPFEPQKTDIFTVPYSYTDLNGHMNNTRYFDLAEDRMPPALRERPIRTIQTEFGAEARAGEAVTLQSAATDTAFSLSGETDRRVFRLLLTYA